MLIFTSFTILSSSKENEPKICKKLDMEASYLLSLPPPRPNMTPTPIPSGDMKDLLQKSFDSKNIRIVQIISFQVTRGQQKIMVRKIIGPCDPVSPSDPVCPSIATPPSTFTVISCYVILFMLQPKKLVNNFLASSSFFSRKLGNENRKRTLKNPKPVNIRPP